MFKVIEIFQAKGISKYFLTPTKKHACVIAVSNYKRNFAKLILGLFESDGKVSVCKIFLLKPIQIKSALKSSVFYSLGTTYSLKTQSFFSPTPFISNYLVFCEQTRNQNQKWLNILCCHAMSVDRIMTIIKLYKPYDWLYGNHSRLSGILKSHWRISAKRHKKSNCLE